MKKGIKQAPVDKWIIDPILRFMGNSSTSGMVLFGTAALALVVANSPWADAYHQIWKIEFSIGFSDFMITKNLHHWINDGLMAMFFFVIGLELKREIVAGELSKPRDAILPIAAALGGMIVPAVIYLLFNSSGEASNGWGIPMATDIAFALGVVYLLGDKAPFSLKIFLTVLAIVDDIGAVLVIAFFYTSKIDFTSLLIGAGFMGVLIVSNRIGVRNTVYYAIIGIGGLWLAFLMSGVHATIAAVLAAFTIPADTKVSGQYFSDRLSELLGEFRTAQTSNLPIVTHEQYSILEAVRNVSRKALTPLQRLEHGMHPMVIFVIMPIFAFSNAGVSLSGDFFTQLTSPVSSGVFMGLLLGKVLGIFGLSYLLLKMRWVTIPEGMKTAHLLGAAFLAAIGFTMSLFITDLAFSDDTYVLQAKLGILLASLVASIAGFFIIRNAGSTAGQEN